VWVAGSVGGWEFGEGGHPEEVFGMRALAAQGGGVASIAAGMGGACGAVLSDGGLVMFGAPVTHLGRSNLPAHDPTAVLPRTVRVGENPGTVAGTGVGLRDGEGGNIGGEEVLPGRDGVEVRGLALGGAHAVCTVVGL
jgi:hypothetical protein